MAGWGHPAVSGAARRNSGGLRIRGLPARIRLDQAGSDKRLKLAYRLRNNSGSAIARPAGDRRNGALQTLARCGLWTRKCWVGKARMTSPARAEEHRFLKTPARKVIGYKTRCNSLLHSPASKPRLSEAQPLCPSTSYCLYHCPSWLRKKVNARSTRKGGQYLRGRAGGGHPVGRFLLADAAQPSEQMECRPAED